MAKTFALVDTAAAVTLDILAGTYRLAPGGWRTAFPSAINSQMPSRFGLTQSFERYEAVAETIDLVARAADSAILTAEQTIETFRENIRLWHSDKLQTKSVWLHAYSAAESAKRSLLYDLKLEHLAQNKFTPLLGNSAVKARLALVRHPLWEDTTTTSLIPGGVTLNMTGGIRLFTGAQAGGTAPGRINYLAAGMTAGGTLDKIWIGIRETYGGTANFVSLWELELGTAGTDTSAGADATASAGNRMRCTFATVTTLAKRVAITRANVYVTAGDDDFTGRYLVLMRCQLSGAGSVGVQMKYGYTGTSNFAVCEEKQPITNTAWQLIELGEIQLPPLPPNYSRAENLNGFDLWQGVEIQLFAERLSGAMNFDLDALILIPSDHFLSAENLGLSGTSTLIMDTLENDENLVTVQTAPSTIVNGSVNFTARDFYVPVGGGLIVMAGQQAAAHSLTTALELNVYFYRRWLTLRGS